MQYRYTNSPLTEHIASQIKQRIHEGEFSIGDRMPSVRKLAAQYQISPATALGVYRYLESTRCIEAHARAGFFVRAAPRAQSKQEALRPAPSTSELADAQTRMSHLLALSSSTMRMQFHMAEAASSFYPADLFARRLSQTLIQAPNLIGSYMSYEQQSFIKEEFCRWQSEAQHLEFTEDVLFTNGTTEALSLALRHLTKPGDTVAIEAPVYFGLLQTLQSLGLNALEIPCSMPHGMSIETLEFILDNKDAPKSSKLKCLITTPSFHNPTGALMPEENRKKLLTLAKHHELPVIEDNTFGELYFGKYNLPPIKAWDTKGDVIYCGAFTKSFAPSFRVGYLLGGRHHDCITGLRTGSTFLNSPLLLTTVAQMLANGDYARFNQQLREQLLRQMGLWRQCILDAFPNGTSVHAPQGGMVFWIECPPNVDSAKLLSESLKRSISFAPGFLFSLHDKFSNFLRICFGQPFTTEVHKAILTIGELAKKQLLNS